MAHGKRTPTGAVKSQPQGVKFGQIIFTSLSKQKQNTTGAIEPQKRILELERQLEDEKLRSEAYARMIEKAEKELKISIRKKPLPSNP